MIINPLIYSGMDHFWLKQPRESIEFNSRFFHSKLFHCLNSMTFRGHTSSSKNLKQKSHQACTVWKKFGIYLLQCVKTCDFLFFFHSPSPMIWSCFFLLFIFSTIYHFSFSTFRWVKSLLHRNFILMFQSWKLFFMRQHSRISIFILPCFPLQPSHSQTLIYHHPFKARTFFAQGMSNSCIGFSFENKKNCLIR